MQLRRNLVKEKVKKYKSKELDTKRKTKKNKLGLTYRKGRKDQSSDSASNCKAKNKSAKNRTICEKADGEKKHKTHQTDIMKDRNIFEKREKLIDFLSNEKSFKIQIFSLESVEIFEVLLKVNRIEYKKGFTTTFKNSRAVQLLIDDGKLSDEHANQKLILYSNNRNFDFIPYKFKLSVNEKNNICEELLQLDRTFEADTLNGHAVKALSNGSLTKEQREHSEGIREILQVDNIKIDRDLIALNPRSSLTSMFSDKLNVYGFTEDALNYTQSVIVMGMIGENKFIRIFNEVKSIDPSLDNKFLIKCELNSLINKKICTKNGDLYKLSISNLTVQNICKKIGFKHVFA